MRSKSRLRRRTFVRPSVSLSNAEPSRFFKIILSGTIHTQDMDVPALFWRDYMGKLGPIKLQDSTGQKWSINLRRYTGSIRIGKGWIGFARANNVKEGDVCV
ncbi:B3 domain-containing protein REM-like 1 isoform X2 [Prosopis cineraria]|uniref:B3 domain-containing protein REM-like 1 isoform X2 n=1 Tax=Prosopis cineraria TaxID=364024 RepID=UPI002410A739|nr:B3 domain-containing protein REM-like 1 isoform X2 [Prosopis cineraria]